MVGGSGDQDRDARVRGCVLGLGAQGDGLVQPIDLDGGLIGEERVHVPFVLPGETVEAVKTGDAWRAAEITAPHPARIGPVCPHFTHCGGCAMQHAGAELYAEWKSGLVRSAFAQRGLSPTLLPLISVGLGARRRVVLTARMAGGLVLLGFHAPRSHDVVAIENCPIADARILEKLDGLRGLAQRLVGPKRELRLNVLAADNGICVDAEGSRAEFGAKARLELAEVAKALQLVRLTVDADPVYLNGQPMVTFGAARVSPFPGAFLQAAVKAETVMSQIAVAALPKRSRRVADLFCGLGALTFPLAARVQVFAADSSGEALKALEAGANQTQGLKKIETRQRDLMREPLSRKELEPFEMVVFDPPRAGAKEQAIALTKSNVPVVVAVSCNPATLARDMRILVDGGYVIASVQPIDQFVYAPHVESVVVLKRP